LDRKRSKKKTVDKQVPNSVQEQGKQMRQRAYMEPTIGLEPMTC
jgi:hypothetical protein